MNRRSPDQPQRDRPINRAGTSGHVVRIPFALRQEMIDAAERAYPQECCGILIGARNRHYTNVHRVVTAANIADGDRTRRYQIDWRTLLVTVKTARDHARTARKDSVCEDTACEDTGCEDIIGFYHSHPDGSTAFSRHDARHAWVNYAYVILGLRDGRYHDAACWRICTEDADATRDRLDVG